MNANDVCAHCGHPRSTHTLQGCTACREFSASTKMWVDCDLFVDRTYRVGEVQK